MPETLDVGSLRLQVGEARDLMERGRLVDALETLQDVFVSADRMMEDSPVRGLQGVMDAARRLVAEVRGRMAETVLAGACPTLSGNDPGVREAVLADIRFLLSGPGLSERQRTTLDALAERM